MKKNNHYKQDILNIFLREVQDITNKKLHDHIIDKPKNIIRINTCKGAGRIFYIRPGVFLYNYNSYSDSWFRWTL